MGVTSVVALSCEGAPMNTVTLVYEGAPACVDCQRGGVPVCAHVGFNDAGWVGLPGKAVHAPGLDKAYAHVVKDVEISADRKTVTLTTETQLPEYHDLARHLSLRPDWRAKAWVRAVDETGATLEEGYYDRPLNEGENVAIDRAVFLVKSVAYPNRNAQGVAADPGDLQVATLAPVQVDAVTSPDLSSVSGSIFHPGGLS